jgi:hypothetical protein
MASWPATGTTDWNTKMLAFLDQFVNTSTGDLKTTWTSWTPVLEQGGTVTATINYAKYVKIGDTIIASCNLTATGSGTGNNEIFISGLPVNMTTGISVGSGKIVDTGSKVYTANVNAVTANKVQFEPWDLASPIGVTPNFALASSDVITFTVTYEDVT